MDLHTAHRRVLLFGMCRYLNSDKSIPTTGNRSVYATVGMLCDWGQVPDTTTPDPEEQLVVEYNFRQYGTLRNKP